MRLLQSLSRGLEALSYMTAQSDPVRLTDVAEALGLDKSNAAHLLKTLVAKDYAVQDDNRRYRPSARVVGTPRTEHTLEEIVAVKEAWRGTLETLVAETGECAHLAVLVGSRVWYIDKVDSPLPLKVDHPIGAHSPLHYTALGKAFLSFGRAQLPDDQPVFTPAPSPPAARWRKRSGLSWTVWSMASGRPMACASSASRRRSMGRRCLSRTIVISTLSNASRPRILTSCASPGACF